MCATDASCAVGSVAGRTVQLETKFADAGAFEIGTAHAYRGEVDAAFTWLERAYRQRDGAMVSLRVDPLVRNLRNDTRYKVLLRKMNLPD